MPLEVSEGFEPSSPDEVESRGFSRVSTGDSDIPSSCETNNEPALKPQQGNPAFFQVRESRCPFHVTLDPANSGSLSHTYC